MSNWKRLLTILAVALAALALLLLTAGTLLTNFLVDYWWFNSLEYGSYFWLQLLYRYIISGGVTLFFFLIFFLNFLAASRFLGVDEDDFEALGDTEDGQRSQQWLRLIKTGSMRLYTPLSAVLAVMIAAPFYHDWELALLYLFGPDAGFSDPVYNVDLRMFFFVYPLFHIVQLELFKTFAILTVAIAGLYWVEHQFMRSESKEWPRAARIHVSGLILATAAIIGWGLILERHGLLYTTAHEPVFFGPGLVEMRYVLPLIWFSIGILVVTTVFSVSYMQTGRGLRGMLGGFALFALSFGLRELDVLPTLLDRFVVKPNPVKAERSFMANNIKATQTAYGLDQIKTIDITAAQSGAEMIDPRLREALHNIPIWDPEYLDDVYQQLQGIRPYYNFTDVDVGRYEINGQIEQVNLAARELNMDKLPKEAQTWENRHLRYTHGFGVVVTPANQRADQPMQWFMRDLSMQSDVGLKVEKPDIYFGMEKLDYVVVPNRLNVVDISSFDVDSRSNYTGEGGIPIHSLFRKAILSLYLRDEKLFFSVNIDGKSRMLLRRNIVERIKTITPFLKLDRDPYVVVTPSRIFWVQDAYTTSDWYPVSKPTEFKFAGDKSAERFNYIRNSVKVVVDAFGGGVDYYVTDPTDPLVMAYARAYPGVFKNINELPPLLRDQLRFPQDLLSIQMDLYARYHQNEPELFYQQAETWDYAKVAGKRVNPYYMTTDLECCRDMQNFVLINPMTPIGRDNLSALGIAGSLKLTARGTPFASQMVLYKFSRDVQVEGPAQVSALIDQDPDIARLFSLWDQKGSHVQRGRIIMLPIGRSLLYVQPVYIVSTANTKIPELARIILSMGHVVAMDTTLEKALNKLEQKLKAVRPMGDTPPTPPVPSSGNLPAVGPIP